MREGIRRTLYLALAGLLASPALMAQEASTMEPHLSGAPYIGNTNQPFNFYTWATTHNAFSNGADYRYWYQNQSHTVREQLNAGVRGLMLDAYESNGRVRVCHVSCDGIEKPLASYFSDDILPFLAQNPQAVVTVFLEDYVSQASLQAELARAPGLGGQTFSPGSESWKWRAQWPSLQEMIDANQRLLIFALNGAAGTYRVGSADVEVIRQESGTVENYWSIGDTIFTHDYSCKSRFSTPLNKRQVDWPGKAWPPLFVMNHFHGVGESLHARLDNRYDKLQDRYNNYCGPASDGRPVNFLAVDFYQQGDTLEFAGVKTNGGLVLYEGNNVSQDVVCGIPAAPSRTLQFKVNGCENDEARSGRLENVPAGTEFHLYDSPSGSTSDDYAVLKTKRGVARVDIPSFEKSVETDEYQLTFHRYNGLDGKISRVEVVAPRRP